MPVRPFSSLNPPSAPDCKGEIKVAPLQSGSTRERGLLSAGCVGASEIRSREEGRRMQWGTQGGPAPRTAAAGCTMPDESPRPARSPMRRSDAMLCGSGESHLFRADHRGSGGLWASRFTAHRQACEGGDASRVKAGQLFAAVCRTRANGRRAERRKSVNAGVQRIKPAPVRVRGPPEEMLSSCQAAFSRDQRLISCKARREASSMR